MQKEALFAIRRLTDAWMRKDKREMSRSLADDIIEIGPALQSALAGKRGFFRKYKEYLTGPREILSYEIVRPRTIRLSARLAMVHFSYKMRTRTYDLVEDSRGKESMLLEKRRDRWLIKFIHWHRDPDPSLK